MNKEIETTIEDVMMTKMFSESIQLNEEESITIDSGLPEILFITSYPPRECGIATYSQDLFKALNKIFNNSFSLKVCALESGTSDNTYPDEVKHILDTTDSPKYAELANTINNDKSLRFVVVQHEFGLFQNGGENNFLQFLYSLTKPIVVVFHTVLPHPDEAFRIKVRNIAGACESIVVMTKNAAHILSDDYGVPVEKIEVIPHGTHLVQHADKEVLKAKYGLTGKKVLSTFGLLSSGKGIETTLNSLPEIIKINPDVAFLVIGKTHPGVLKREGEKYRDMLEAKVEELNLGEHVKFINSYVPLQDLLEYLQLTDIYLFTSKDPNQAVSGTFSYAMSCACPIISTPIPHAREVLSEKTGIIIDFQNSQQLADAVNHLLGDDSLRMAFSASTLQRIVPTAWENSAIAHAELLQKIARQSGFSDAGRVNITPESQQIVYRTEKLALQYRLPDINLGQMKRMTTEFAMIQFSKFNQPDIESGYTLDDNARAMIAVCMHYEITQDKEDLEYIRKYLSFIKFCHQPGGNFLNYVDSEKRFTEQNYETNLADSNGRAIWALGHLISKGALLPQEFISEADEIIQQALPYIEMMHSTRSMAFAIKGLYYSNIEKRSVVRTMLITTLANRLVQMFLHESEQKWQWYESYLTYANSILPEAMLCAWLETGDLIYKKIAKASFDFLLSLTFRDSRIKVISNKCWMHRGNDAVPIVIGGEQPIDVAYTILAMSKFYSVFKEENYFDKLTTAFSWFLGNNHLHQIVYNHCTGGCYDGLEDEYVNLNQGAESTLSFLMARMTIEKHLSTHKDTMMLWNEEDEVSSQQAFVI